MVESAEHVGLLREDSVDCSALIQDDASAPLDGSRVDQRSGRAHAPPLP
jgi:hypothetical protein